MKTAVSISFDDGREDTYRVAFSIMKKYGLRGTIHVATGYIDGSWEGGCFSSSAGPLSVEQLREMKAEGFEISSHGDRHVTEKQDLTASLKKLKEWELVGGEVGFSIPKSKLDGLEKQEFSVFLKDKGVLYMRGGRSSSCYTPWSKACYVMYRTLKLTRFYKMFNSHNLMERPGAGEFDRYNLSSVVIRGEDDPETVVNFIRQSAGSGKWIILMLHGIQNKGDPNYQKDQWCLSSEKFEQLCRSLKEMSDAGQISVMPIMDVIKGGGEEDEG